MASGVLHFGDCSINIAARELLRAGERVNLSPVVFDCIAYLIQHRERAVGRDELVAAVWGRTQVSDAVMGKTILTARRAIGDTAEDQRFLRTVPRFGYQWGAPTHGDDAAPAASVLAPEPAAPLSPAPTQPSPRDIGAPRRWIVFAPLLVLALLFAAYAGWRSRPVPERTDVGAIPSSTMPADLTVVLPVEVSASTEDGWLRLGLMDLIATRLRASGLIVLPSDNVVRLVPADATRVAAIAAVRRVAPHGRVIAVAVGRTGDDWVVRAELVAPEGDTRAVQAQSGNAIAAAGEVADRLLESIGRRAPREAMNAQRLSQAELLQRVDAARLAGDPAQARALVAAADAALQAQPEVQLRIAQVDLRTGEFEAARTRLATLASTVPAESDALLHARVQSYLCIALARVGRMQDGIAACDHAIALLESRAQPAELGRVYSDRGIIRLLLQQYDLAGQDFARARIALTLAGDALQLAKVDGNESTLDTAQGRYADAIEIQQRIGAQFERFGMINELAASLSNRTDAHLALLEPKPALETSDRAFALLERVTDASIRHLIRLQRAEALERNGRLGEARIALDEVIAATSNESATAEHAIAQAREARLDLAAGQFEAAVLLARQASPALPAPPYADIRAETWLSLIRGLLRVGHGDEAEHELAAFTAWANAGSDPVAQRRARLAQAEQAAAARHLDVATRAYDEALAMAQRRGVPDALAEVVSSYGAFLLAQGDLPQASAVIGRIARYAPLDFDAAVLQARLYRALGQEQAFRIALAQARELAGERPLPPALEAPASPLEAPAPPRKDGATEPQ
jgi:DNA-binding winged helix-turn-helix (wHTH) protein/tetratricopeptide (TPR) repeat protein